MSLKGTNTAGCSTALCCAGQAVCAVRAQALTSLGARGAQFVMLQLCREKFKLQVTCLVFSRVILK